MSNFQAAYNRTVLVYEGGYAKDPKDPGGETYRGVSRKHHGNWAGWSLIDTWKRSKSFPGCLDKDEKLQDLVKKFYLEFYWNPLQLSLNPVNIVAQELFDSAVHQGTTTATIQLQRSLNVLNKNSKLWSDLKVDGQYGAKTHEAVIACLNEVPVSLLLTPVRALRVSRMIELIERNENLERFSAGWFARVPCWSLDQHQTS